MSKKNSTIEVDSSPCSCYPYSDTGATKHRKFIMSQLLKDEIHLEKFRFRRIRSTTKCSSVHLLNQTN